jgi:DNA-binding transcriptional regulator of glucitol operon
MDYIFLVVAAFWVAQFGMAYWQLRRFHGRVAELRRLGRCAIGMHGNRWRGRTYAALVIDDQATIRKAEVFDGWTVLSQLRPAPALEGQPLHVLNADHPPLGNLRPAQWAAFQHAATFLQPKAAPTAQLA